MFEGATIFVLRVRQGPTTVEGTVLLPSVDNLLHMARFMDRKLLEDTGVVLPDREWSLHTGAVLDD